MLPNTKKIEGPVFLTSKPIFLQLKLSGHAVEQFFYYLGSDSEVVFDSSLKILQSETGILSAEGVGIRPRSCKTRWLGYDLLNAYKMHELVLKITT